MNTRILDSLPEPHHSAVRDELDEGERLLWVGTPDPGAWGRRHLSTILFFAVLVFVLGSPLVTQAVIGRVQGWYAEAEPSVRAQATASSMAMGVVGLVLVVASLVAPFVAMGVMRRRALQTVYGITPTRVFSVLVKRDGRRQLSAIEPGHPLATTRIEHRRGTGDVHLYPTTRSAPSGGPSAQFSLLGIARPREVERLIRATYDPPSRPTA